MKTKGIPTMPPIASPPLLPVGAASRAGLGTAVAKDTEDEQSDGETHRLLVLGGCVLSTWWKNVYADGERASGLSWPSPWARSSALVT
ncbi:hypothetical protein CASFOL_037620 [Castilleja foliolosa]|uniref:Uncharacterized protein n=1 Tax=Castilleja foliolosa TaxID=1961234 RepID=A0ABD3BM36_9LAMI